MSTSSGSKPPASNPPPEATLSRPKRRGSTKRSSRPEASFAIAWVCLATSSSGAHTTMRPVMPRWTIHCEVEPSAGVRFRRLAGRITGAVSLRSRSNTMCLPIRRTCAMRVCSSVLAISAAGDFMVCGFDPSQTDSIWSPATRFCNPRAMVSTSGSSGTRTSLQSSVPSRQPVAFRSSLLWRASRRRPTLDIPRSENQGGCIAESADSQYLPTCD